MACASAGAATATMRAGVSAAHTRTASGPPCPRNTASGLGRCPAVDRTSPDAIATLAGYHRVVSVDGGISHTLMGPLRRLKVETWALLGFCEQDQTAGALVNASAAFEQAYTHIVVRDVEIASLCRAFGMPHAKMRYWPDHGVDLASDALGLAPLTASVPAQKLKQAV